MTITQLAIFLRDRDLKCKIFVDSTDEFSVNLTARDGLNVVGSDLVLEDAIRKAQVKADKFL